MKSVTHDGCLKRKKGWKYNVWRLKKYYKCGTSSIINFLLQNVNFCL